MSADEENNEENQEEENQSIHTEEEQPEENSEENTEIEDELTYREQLETYFTSIEESQGLEAANIVRQKFAGARQIEYFIALEEWAEELFEMQAEAISEMRTQNTELYKLIKRLLELKIAKLTKPNE